MRLFLMLFLIEFAFVTAGTVNNVQGGEFWHKMKLDWHRLNSWPEPFIHQDRSATRSPFGVMINDGWQRQTTLGQYHFNPETHELNEAGLIKLDWILTRIPEQRRVVFVERSRSVDDSASRVDSVQRYAARLITHGPLPPVVQTYTPPVGTPADAVNSVYVKLNATIPNPRLPAPTLDQEQK
jgi:hypothetical protein